MFVRVKQRSSGKFSVQIVESVRKHNKVLQRIMRHVGQAQNDREIEELKRLAQTIIAEIENKRQPILPIFDPEQIYPKKRAVCKDKVSVSDLREEQRVSDGIKDVFGKLYCDLGLEKAISGTKKDKQWNSVFLSCVLARLANPVSKRRTASLLEEDYGIKIPLEKIYRMMDHVAEREDVIREHIKTTTLSLLQKNVDVVFFDVTTLYFESQETDDLKNFGFSKDCKFKESQVVLALVTTEEGLPITYHLFPGDIYEGHTLISIVDDLRKTYSIGRVLLVADRAMFDKNNLDYMDKEKIPYIVAARLRSMSKDTKEAILNEGGFGAVGIDGELYWTKELSSNGRRLIVSYSGRRAKKDASDRQRLIDRLLKKVRNGKIRLNDVIPNYGTKKYLTLSNNTALINEAKIEEDSRWDGLHGVITSESDMKAEDVLTRYRGLWQIEEAFRVSKHELKMRPIYHWTPDRIKAHILICYVTYALVKQLIYRIRRQQEPMSFEQIRNELLHAQSSILVDNKTLKRYVVPSHLSVNQRKIYQVVGLKRSDVPYELT